MSATTGEEQQEQSWYREQSSTKPDSLAIVQQKAAIRAEQRMVAIGLAAVVRHVQFSAPGVADAVYVAL